MKKTLVFITILLFKLSVYGQTYPEERYYSIDEAQKTPLSVYKLILTDTQRIGNISKLSKVESLYIYTTDYSQLNTILKKTSTLSSLRSVTIIFTKNYELPYFVYDLVRNLTEFRNIQSAELMNSSGSYHLDYLTNTMLPLPEFAKKSTRLYHLYIENTNNAELRILLEKISKMTLFQSLTITKSYQLTALPENIGNLTTLESIVIQNTQLTKLPKSIKKLTKLNYLYLSNNQLKYLPESIGKLNIKVLGLSNNKIEKLPIDFSELTSLNYLGLSNNQLSIFPIVITKLKHLFYLNLSSNLLTESPVSISQLTQLSNLDLSNNQLKAIPESMAQLTKLQNLNLSKNKLSEFPQGICEMKDLRKLKLDHNLLTRFPINICDCIRINDSMPYSYIDITFEYNQLVEKEQLRYYDCRKK